MIRQITSTPEQYEQHLKIAKQIVASWPEWKRNMPATSFDGNSYKDATPTDLSAWLPLPDPPAGEVKG